MNPTFISVGKIAYVSNVGEEMLNAIEDYEGTNVVLSNDELLMLSFEELEDHLELITEPTSKVEEFLINTTKEIRYHHEESVWDILFSK